MQDQSEQRRVEDEINRSSASNDPFASAVRATRMPMLITDPRRPDNPIVFVNDAFAKLTGYSRDECLGRNCRFLQGTATNHDDVDRVRDAVARRVPIEIDLMNYRKDGSAFWNRLLVSPVFDADGELAFFFASQFDVSPERNRLEEIRRDRATLEHEIERRLGDLGRSEERLRFTMKAGRLGAWTLDLASHRLVASVRCKQNFGRAATDNFSYDDLVGSIHPGDIDRWRDMIEASLSDPKGELEVEYRAITPQGDIRWIEVRGQVNRDADGTPIGMAGVSLDITDRKRSEEHRDLLTRELDHRVKNTLANVQSIVSQTLRAAPSLEEGAKMLTHRIHALASAHDVLVREGWESADLHDLVTEALRPFQAEGGDRLRFGGPPVRLRARVATTVTLALHELATNATKYGALSNEAGVVTLNWDFEGGDAFRMEWREMDGPVVAASTRRGFGSRILERALPAEMDGTSTVDCRPQGLVFTLKASLAAIVDRSDG